MKRILTLLCVFAVLGPVLAQSPDQPLNNRDYINMQLDSKEVPASASEAFFETQAERMAAEKAGTRGSIPMYTVAYVDAVANSGSDPGLIRTTLWQDSLARIVDADGDFYWFINAFADVFDPNSILINDLYIEDNLSVQFGSGKEYEIDSMYFYYLYNRVTPPSIVDTLRVYVFGEGNIAEQVFSDWPAAGDETDVCYAFYDNPTFSPDAFFESYEFLLTEADTSTAFLRRIGVELETSLGKDRKVGVAFHFLTGQSYSLGDVLFDNTTGTAGVLNNFDIITYEEDDGAFPLSSVTDEGALNQGGIVFTDIRYPPAAGGWDVAYYPTFGFAAGWSSEHVLTEWVVGPIGAHYIAAATSTDCEVQFNDLSNVDGITNWVWDLGDGGLSLDQNPVHTYADNGTYSVELEVRDGDGDTYSYERNVVVNNCGTGVQPIEGLQSFSVFPNPASHVLNLDLALSTPLEMELGIYNSTGELVQQHLIQAGVQFNNSYDVSALPAGFYTLKLQNGNQVSTKGFMIAE